MSSREAEGLSQEHQEYGRDYANTPPSSPRQTRRGTVLGEGTVSGQSRRARRRNRGRQQGPHEDIGEPSAGSSVLQIASTQAEGPHLSVESEVSQTENGHAEGSHIIATSQAAAVDAAASSPVDDNRINGESSRMIAGSSHDTEHNTPSPTNHNQIEPPGTAVNNTGPGPHAGHAGDELGVLPVAFPGLPRETQGPPSDSDESTPRANVGTPVNAITPPLQNPQPNIGNLPAWDFRTLTTEARNTASGEATTGSRAPPAAGNAAADAGNTEVMANAGDATSPTFAGLGNTLPDPDVPPVLSDNEDWCIICRENLMSNERGLLMPCAHSGFHARCAEESFTTDRTTPRRGETNLRLHQPLRCFQCQSIEITELWRDFEADGEARTRIRILERWPESEFARQAREDALRVRREELAAGEVRDGNMQDWAEARRARQPTVETAPQTPTEHNPAPQAVPQAAPQATPQPRPQGRQPQQPRPQGPQPQPQGHQPQRPQTQTPSSPAPSDISMRDRTPAQSEQLDPGDANGPPEPHWILSEDRNDSSSLIWKEPMELVRVTPSAQRFLLRYPGTNPSYPEEWCWEAEPQSRYPGERQKFKDRYYAETGVDYTYMLHDRLETLDSIEWRNLEVFAIAPVWQNITRVDDENIIEPRHTAVHYIGLNHRTRLLPRTDPSRPDWWFLLSDLKRKYGPPVVEPSLHEKRVRTGQYNPRPPPLLGHLNRQPYIQRSTVPIVELNPPLAERHRRGEPRAVGRAPARAPIPLVQVLGGGINPRAQQQQPQYSPQPQFTGPPSRAQSRTPGPPPRAQSRTQVPLSPSPSDGGSPFAPERTRLESQRRTYDILLEDIDAQIRENPGNEDDRLERERIIASLESIEARIAAARRGRRPGPVSVVFPIEDLINDDLVQPHEVRFSMDD